MNRRSFIARTVAAAGALAAGKAVASPALAPDDHTLQLAAEQSWKLRQLHVPTFTDVLKTIDGHIVRVERQVHDEQGNIVERIPMHTVMCKVPA
jgi:hypothetical protein